MSFTPEEIRRLDEIRAHYPDARAASVSVMKWVQRRDGHISDAALQQAADYLGLPASDLEGLATFYNLLFRRPVGRNVVKICDSVSCWMNGYESVRDRLQEKLGIGFGQTTDDGEFTLLPVVCLGNCDNAPTLMVNEDLHHRVTADVVDAILAGKNGERGDKGTGGGDAGGAVRGSAEHTRDRADGSADRGEGGGHGG